MPIEPCSPHPSQGSPRGSPVALPKYHKFKRMLERRDSQERLETEVKMARLHGNERHAETRTMATQTCSTRSSNSSTDSSPESTTSFSSLTSTPHKQHSPVHHQQQFNSNVTSPAKNGLLSHNVHSFPLPVLRTQELPVEEPLNLSMSKSPGHFDIDEHFRKSLLQSPKSHKTHQLVPPASANVDDHFSRALGHSEWQKIQANSSPQKPTPKRCEMDVDDHFLRALGDKWKQLQMQTRSGVN